MAGPILITGAGSGFGKEVALRLAADGHEVIAGVEIIAQVNALRAEARERDAPLRVEKLDVTDPGDRENAWTWEVEVLLNNAGVSEGGSMVDIPEERLRRQFEVNVFGTILLTQGVARRMAARRSGHIVFMSSVAGLTVDPFTGAYSGSKHALEAFANALDKELAEFGITVATINPGPFLTGFNDTMFETWKEWRDNPADRLYDYAQLAFPHEQYDSEPVFERTVRVLLGEDRRYRHLLPDEMESQTREQVDAQWDRRMNDGERAAIVQQAYDIAPAEPVRI